MNLRIVRTERYWTDCRDANLPDCAQVVTDEAIPPKGLRRLGIRLVQVTGTYGILADCVARLRSCATIVRRVRD